MSDTFDWSRDDPARKEAHEEFKTAIVEQFNLLYGTEVEDIQAWRGHCLALEIFPLSDNVAGVKEVCLFGSPGAASTNKKRVFSLFGTHAVRIFRRVFVNLVCLIDTESTERSVAQFSSLEEFQVYTIRTGKYFPKDSAYDGRMLRFLLREILNKRQKQQVEALG